MNNCHKTMLYQYLSRKDVSLREHPKSVHTTTRQVHCKICTQRLPLFFHFLYFGMDSSSKGSICNTTEVSLELYLEEILLELCLTLEIQGVFVRVVPLLPKEESHRESQRRRGE